MFDKNVYVGRRAQLRKKVGSGLILLLGNNDSPMNYTANIYTFRQDSTFLYYIGLDQPGLAAVLDLDENTETLFGNDVTIEDIVWTGPLPTIKSLALKSGIKNQMPLARLDEVIKIAIQIHPIISFRKIIMITLIFMFRFKDH